RPAAHRNSRRTAPASARHAAPTPDRRQFRDHGQRHLPAHFFTQCPHRRPRHGSRQLQRFLLQSLLLAHHRFPAQRFQRRIFPYLRLHSPKPSRMESRHRIRQHLPPRKLQRHHHRQPELSRQLSLRPRHRNHFRLHRPPSRSRAIRLHPRPDPRRQLDRQRRPALGPLPAPAQSKRRQPASSRSPLFPKNKCHAPLLLRPHLSNSVVREHPALQFQRGAVLRTQRSAPARATLPRQLLRRRSQQKLLRTIPFRRQPLPPRRQQLCRRRPDFQHQHQLPHRLRKSHPLRRRSQTRTPALEALLRLPQRILHRRQRLVPGHRRPFARRKQNLYPAAGRQHLSPAQRPFPRFPGPAPQRSRTPSLPAPPALLDRRRHSI